MYLLIPILRKSSAKMDNLSVINYQPNMRPYWRNTISTEKCESRVSFTKYQLNELNRRPYWRNTIPTEKCEPSGKYKLYATGDVCATNGRRYELIKEGVKITDKMKKKYNLM